MIRIKRPKVAPAILRNEGRKKTEVLCAEYAKNSREYDKDSLRTDRKIYAHASVKEALKECQHNKCCYSEAIFASESEPVEHYRPKGAVGEEGSKKKNYPGYYWLAYEWTNLLRCKTGLNSKKRDLFPLENENLRARCHSVDISEEMPLIIDPAAEDPRDHIRFHKDVPYGITSRGEYTVELLLNHLGIATARSERFKILWVLKNILKLSKESGDDKEVTQAKKILEDAVKPQAEYSSMAIDLLLGSNDK